MKKIILFTIVALFGFFDAIAQVEYKIITSVESIVPSGIPAF